MARLATPRSRCALKLGEELRAHLKGIHERLQKVTIENSNYDYILKRLDSPNTLFYIDPPYWDCENVYGKGFGLNRIFIC
jgi:DNA adenine methylase